MNLLTLPAQPFDTQISAATLYRPPPHGAAGAWDEIVFAIGLMLSIVIFIALALSDRRRDRKEKDDSQDT